MRYAALAVPGFLAVFGDPAVLIDETCVELVAGQPVPADRAVIVGQVCLEVQGSDLSIRFSAGDGWSIAETQLVVASLVGLENLAPSCSGPGQDCKSPPHRSTSNNQLLNIGHWIFDRPLPARVPPENIDDSTPS